MSKILRTIATRVIAGYLVLSSACVSSSNRQSSPMPRRLTPDIGAVYDYITRRGNPGYQRAGKIFYAVNEYGEEEIMVEAGDMVWFDRIREGPAGSLELVLDKSTLPPTKLNPHEFEGEYKEDITEISGLALACGLGGH